MHMLNSEKNSGAVILTLNRPDSLNALSADLIGELRLAISRANALKDVRAILITGSGEKAFCAGIDLKQRRNFSAEEKWLQSRDLWGLLEMIRESPKVVIAAINGWCLGGGFELALACDLRVADETARFGWPEMTLGAYPGGGAAVILPKLIGPAKTKQMLFTARQFSAQQAFEYGLVEDVVSRADLLKASLDYVREIHLTSPLGIAALKQSINMGADLPWEEAAKLDQILRRPLESTKDYEEGIRAHFEKRKPIFIGE